MIEKQTFVNQIELVDGGTTQVRLALCLVEDGAVLSQQWHRTAVGPADDVASQMVAVNAHLADMGWPLVSAEDTTRITKAHSLSIDNTASARAALNAP